uniref:Uncharacterized protein n=1 Tax=Peronospora matthiolae TaxID=2874970 RepID=A0AAV1U4J5_9STRA
MDAKQREDTLAVASAAAQAADASAPPRKKSRGSGCDKSEFVSVKAGMRELNRRLAAASEDAVASDSFSPAASTTTAIGVSNATREDVKSCRVKTKTTSFKAARPVKKRRASKVATTGGDEDDARSDASKKTLAEVKRELEREQRKRVESRIQTLQWEAEATAYVVSLTSRAHNNDGPRGCVKQGGDKQLISGNRMEEPAVASPLTMIDANRLRATSTCKAGSTTLHMPVKALDGSSVEPPCKNEFITGDVDEDVVYALALEEAEQKLATPQKPLPSRSGSVSATNSNFVASRSLRVPTASPILAQPTLLDSHVHAQMQLKQDGDTQEPKTTDAVQIEANSEIVKEMERLRHENELLRRSNELLRAAALTSPSIRAKDFENEQSRASLDQVHDQNSVSSTSKVTTSGTPAGSFTTRFLNLARCDNEQNVKRMVPSWETYHIQDCTSSRSTGSQQTSSSDAQSKDTILSRSGIEKNGMKNQHQVKTKKAQEPDKAVEPESKHSRDVSPQNLAAGSDQFAAAEDKHPSTRSATNYVFDQDNETAQLELLQPKELSSSVQTAHGRCAHTTSGSDDHRGPDVSMLDVEERDHEDGGNDRDEEETVNKDRSSERESTVDNGSYTKYKVRRDFVYGDADDHMDEVCDRKTFAVTTKIATAQALSTHTDSNVLETVNNNESESALKPDKKAKTESRDQATKHKNSGGGGGSVKHKATRVKSINQRVDVAPATVSSKCDSETESDEDLKENVVGSNALEAALKAAEDDTGCKNDARPRSVADGATSHKRRVVKEHRSVAASVSLPVLPASSTTRQQKFASVSSTSVKTSSSIKDTLLWPALDDFYNFLLEMSPRNVRGSDQKRAHLKKYAGGKLPAQYDSVDDYCGLHLEAIMEELMASVSNATNMRSGGRSGLVRNLPLTSVSPCGPQRGATSLNGLSFNAIFSESGYTGNTSSSNDYILTFGIPPHGKKGASDFTSGDLVLVRSPRWKNYNMCVFGVALCGSAGIVGGKSTLGSEGRGNRLGKSDQICVLLRAQERDEGETEDSFSVLTELCLSNHRAPNWRWSLEQVHNVTTSAREYQAIRTIPFVSNDVQQLLLRGRLDSPAAGPTSNNATALSSLLSPRLLKYLSDHYNESQVQAIVGCLRENSRVIVQGPPGTGKTKTVLGLLAALLDGAGLPALGKAKGTARIRVGASFESARKSSMPKTEADTSIRILVAAPSNGAVDELVVRVLSEGLFSSEKGEFFRPRIVRVGRPESDQQPPGLAQAQELGENKENCKKKRKYAHEVEEVLLDTLVSKHRRSFSTVKQTREAVIKNAQIVFCTLSGAGSAAMCEFAQEFDALVIDEAGQAVEASTLIPFKFRPRRVVLVGDHRQLPATVISKRLVTMGYDRSLQQRLVENDSPVLLLSQQYRMHPDIAEFPSAYFYSRRLVQDDNMREWTAQDYHHDRAFKPLLFYDVQGAQSQVSGSTSLRNMNEVEAVSLLVHRLLVTFPQEEWKNRIGVIAPYKQQIYEVRSAIRKLEVAFNRRLDIDVNTVDGFQGREKEIIIYSCVRTSYGGRRKKKRRRHGNDTDENVLDAFWADERRMNVAITRAKSSLWIVGNSKLLKQSRAWKALIRHTEDQSRYIGNSAVFLASPRSTPKI